jgi:hypothetical protein
MFVVSQRYLLHTIVLVCSWLLMFGRLDVPVTSAQG